MAKNISVPQNISVPSQGQPLHRCPFHITNKNWKTPSGGALLQKYISIYQNHYAGNLTACLNLFRNCTLVDALKYAGLAQCPICGAIYPHQFRLLKVARYQFSQALVANVSSFQNINDFEKLFLIVKSIGRNIHGLGGLAIYDAALRISANLGCLPKKKVYLYRGARVRGLGEGPQDIGQFLPPCKALSAYHLEDFLCVFHKERENGVFQVI